MRFTSWASLAALIFAAVFVTDFHAAFVIIAAVIVFTLYHRRGAL